MIITGIAPSPPKLNERTYLPSGELVYLAKKALKEYGATHLITSLTPGWEQALAKAAIELDIPFTVAIPYPGRDAEWDREIHVVYLDLLARAEEVYRVSDSYTEDAEFEGHLWQSDHSDLVLALWEYDFGGETFEVMEYSMCKSIRVVNLWEDWRHLYSLRRKRPSAYVQSARRGARVF